MSKYSFAKEFIVTLIILILIGILCFLALIYLMPEKYKILLSCENCSIGKVEVAGDYTCNENLNPLSWNCHDQAAKDCKAFNDYQKIIGGDEICVA